MEYQIEKRQDCLLIKLSKDITVYQLAGFKDALEKLAKIAEPNSQIIIDLKDVLFMDEFALGILANFSRGIREMSGDVKFIHMNNDIKLIFDLTHLSTVYGIFRNLEEALNSPS
jgi:anti-anti-sigma factor